MSRNDKPRRIVSVDPGFIRHLSAMSIDDQKKCLMNVRWFEGLKPEDHKKRSEAVEGTPRRKLRCVRVTNHLRTIYASADNTREWVWVGRFVDVAGVARSLDEEQRKKPEIVDVETMLRLLHQGHVVGAAAGSNGRGSHNEDVAVQEETPRVGPAVSVADVTTMRSAVDDASLGVAESKSVCEGIVNKLSTLVAVVAKARRSEAEKTETARALQAARAEITVLKGESVALRDRLEALEAEKASQKPAASPQIASLLANYNEVRAERDILADSLKKAKKRAELGEFTGSQVEQVKKMAAEEIRIVKREGETLRAELAAARAALSQRENTSLTDKAKDDLKERCAKVLDNHANVLGRTGRKDLQEQAEELRGLAMTIRAIK